MADRLSLSELARQLGRAKSGLHTLAARGQIPKGPDGKFDFAEVQAALVANRDPARQAGPFSPVRERPNGAVNGGGVATLAPEDAEAVTLEAVLASTLVREVLKAEGHVLDPQAPIDFNLARTAEKIVQVYQRKQHLDAEAERLLDADDITRCWADRVAMFRARMLAMVGDIALALSHLTKHDVSVVDRIVRDALQGVFDEVSAGAG